MHLFQLTTYLSLTTHNQYSMLELYVHTFTKGITSQADGSPNTHGITDG